MGGQGGPSFALGNKLGSSTQLGAGGFSAFAKGEGSMTERTTYLGAGLGGQDKSFISSGGTHGAVGALQMGSGGGGLDSSMLNNLLNTPSSEKSQTKSRMSTDDYKNL